MSSWKFSIPQIKTIESRGSDVPSLYISPTPLLKYCSSSSKTFCMLQPVNWSKEQFPNDRHIIKPTLLNRDRDHLPSGLNSSYVVAPSYPRQTEQSAQIWQKQDGRNINTIKKTISPPNYHRYGFVATHALGHKAIVVITGRGLCLHDCIIITLIYIYYATSKNPSVLNTICFIHSTEIM